MTTVLNEHDVDAWHEWRRGGIGGSDIAGLLLPGKWSSPWKVWAEKVGLLAPTESTQRQRIGQRMEAVLIDLFEEQVDGLHVSSQQTTWEHRLYPWARCTVDGLVFKHGNPIEGSPVGVFEAKTDGRFDWPDGLPANYRAQAIWNMAIVGVQRAFVVAMFSGFRVEVFELAWDDEAQSDWALMFSTAERFWHDHVLTGEAPEVDGSEATSDALSAVYPDHVPGTEVALDDLVSLLDQRDEYKAMRKYAETELSQIDNAIKARFGDAEVGTVDGTPVLTYRTSQRAGYEVQPTTVRTLRAAPKPKGDKQ